MARYMARPVVTTALKIVRVGKVTKKGTPLELEDKSTYIATPEMTARMTPERDDYVVTQPDGYVYLNPKSVFESKYFQLPDGKDGRNLSAEEYLELSSK